MSRLIIAIAAIGLLFGAMHAPRTEAATPPISCTGPAAVTTTTANDGKYWMLQIGGGQQSITGVCIKTANGVETDVTAGGNTSIVGGCYFVYKTQKLVVVAIDSGYVSGCPAIQGVKVRTVRGNAG